MSDHSELIETLRFEHWLMFAPHPLMPGHGNVIIGCHCGFDADVDADSGLGDSVANHLMTVGLKAAEVGR